MDSTPPGGGPPGSGLLQGPLRALDSGPPGGLVRPGARPSPFGQFSTPSTPPVAALPRQRLVADPLSDMLASATAAAASSRASPPVTSSRESPAPFPSPAAASAPLPAVSPAASMGPQRLSVASAQPPAAPRSTPRAPPPPKPASERNPEDLCNWLLEGPDGRPVSVPPPVPLDVPATPAGVLALEAQGEWERVLELSGLWLASNAYPRDLGGDAAGAWLAVKTARVSALFASRRFLDARGELMALGDLDAALFVFPPAPAAAAARSSSVVVVLPTNLVPLRLRLLHAELPVKLSDPRLAIDRLYALSELLATFIGGSAPAALPVSHAQARVWRERVMLTLATHLVTLHEYQQAVALCAECLQAGQAGGLSSAAQRRARARLLSGAARIFLQMGDVDAADQLYAKAGAHCATPWCWSDSAAPPASPGAPAASPDVMAWERLRMNMLDLNQGMLSFAHGRYAEAHTSFVHVAERLVAGRGGGSGSDADSEEAEAEALEAADCIAASTNVSVCALYAGELKRAMLVCEDLVKRNPRKFLVPAVASNLCGLYDLALDTAAAEKRKRALMVLAQRFRVPLDFESCRLALEPASAAPLSSAAR